MRWYVSYPILAAGLAVGFDTFFPDRPIDARSGPAEVVAASTEVTTPHVVLATDIDHPFSSRLGAFSPGDVLATTDLGTNEGSRTSLLDYLAQTLSPLDPTPVVVTTSSTAATSVTATAWTSAVIPAQPIRVADAKPVTRQGPASRVALARDIQAELRRVGCYGGDIDGIWGGGSKRAASAFMDRVNASLPTHEPDVFLLSLLRAQDDEVCGAACPHGQGLVASGRCVPSTLLAQAGKARGTSRGETMTGSISEPPLSVAAAQRTVPFGRMGVGGPRPDETTAVAALDTSSPASERSGATAYGPQRPAVVEGETVQEAALDPQSMPKVEPTSFDSGGDPSPPKARTAKRNRPARETASPRYSSYRHVQRLFEHPLGRM